MILKNCLIVDPLDGEYTGEVLIEKNIIKKITQKTLSYDKILMPGFIDTHTHGYNGIDTMNATKEEFKKWSLLNFKNGVTTFFPTTVTASNKNLLKVLDTVEKINDTSIKGVHLEGPFINKEKMGAQNPDYIRIFTNEELNELMRPIVKIMTISPELNDISAFNDVKLSIGHSNGKYEDFKNAFKKGINRITHFPNALRPLHHREIGGMGSGLYFDFNLELICDGYHTSPEFIDMVYKIKGADKLFLITDSISATNLNDGTYTLGDLNVFVKDNKATLKNGTIAGSTLKFIDAVKNFKKFTNCTLQELSKVSSYNAAKDLKLEKIGRIKEEFYANIVVLDKNLNILKTIFNGIDQNISTY
ncbi:N-acetylglucosamine-6-phosphate deacetylase [Tepiditoga spiralis]|uniref:N-acetylglucosamine-6-phosphate deacetylase n=1 Tax=Tepiditoga spiralis TaxID=2108365 RepID=A0A7G1G5I7_9BACT|nr:N-acetylglucosamine-6-phosphate deacetylase [Tepiditoga spiralis]BBE31671.1 N-acetylglucosamine-6-phosphate deacetylase [Tepiditoga spiralis]